MFGGLLLAQNTLPVYPFSNPPGGNTSAIIGDYLYYNADRRIYRYSLITNINEVVYGNASDNWAKPFYSDGLNIYFTERYLGGASLNTSINPAISNWIYKVSDYPDALLATSNFAYLIDNSGNWDANIYKLDKVTGSLISSIYLGRITLLAQCIDGVDIILVRNYPSTRVEIISELLNVSSITLPANTLGSPMSVVATPTDIWVIQQSNPPILHRIAKSDSTITSFTLPYSEIAFGYKYVLQYINETNKLILCEQTSNESLANIKIIKQNAIDSNDVIQSTITTNPYPGSIAYKTPWTYIMCAGGAMRVAI